MAKPHSFFLKLFLGNLLLVGLIVVLGGLVSYEILNAHYQVEVEQRQQQFVRIAQQYFEDHWDGMNDSQIDAACKEMMPDWPMRLTVIAADGRVLGESNPNADPRKMDNHRTPERPELLEALDGKAGAARRRSDTLGVEFRYHALPIHHNSRVVGAVRVSEPVKAIIEGGTFIWKSLLWAASAAVLAAVLLGLLLSWLWYSPLRQVTAVAKKIAAGDFTARARLAETKELSQLAMSINEMRDSLSGQIQLIAAQSENLETVVANLREGVIATDRRDRIVLINRSAVTLLAIGAEDVIDQPLQVVVRSPEIIRGYTSAMKTGRNMNTQLEIDAGGQRCSLDVHAMKIAEAADSAICGLLVIRDITDISRTAAMKAEFVANASHELRTPLTTIRAVVDSLGTLEPGDSAGREKLYAMLDRHVTRLENMANDLLDLNAVERPADQLRLEDISLPSLAEWTKNLFTSRAKEKNLSFLVETLSPQAFFRSDRKLVELMLRNLLDNAIKFTPAGSVECRLEQTDEDIVICVSDTGVGIRKEDQPRVFERFFQADSSRSGDSRIRGTGLGLAIVRHAAEQLNARIELQSELGRGTTITISIPTVNPV